VQHGAVTIVYDGDGNRVSKTAGGVTTKYLVSELNPTGYVQVMDELVGGSVSRRYTYGLDLISQELIANGQGRFFYSYDGHGSVRQLTNSAGNLTDSYTYDAFGNLIEQTGTTPNLYLYAGEQFDSDLGLYYNRARYLDVRNGRFWNLDSVEGGNLYWYADADPVNNHDPSGNETLAVTLGGTLPSLNTLAQATAISLVAACTLQLTLANAGDEAGFDVDPNSGPCVPKYSSRRLKLYHYTAFPNLDQIRTSQILFASLETAGDAFFGPGQYFTDITPGEASTATKGQLSYALYGLPFKWFFTDVAYIGVDTPERSTRRVASVYGQRFPGRGIYLRKSVLPMKLTNRIIDYGVVRFIGDK